MMNKEPEEISKILRILEEAQTVCIVGHVSPDGDCIGSQLALGFCLKRLGKTVFCWNENEIPDKLAFLDEENMMRKPKNGCAFDVVVALDCASFQRLGSVGEKIANRKHFINIDHHASNTRYGDVNWVIGDSAATGELIFQLIQAAGWEITPSIADCLFIAISTDTGSFQYSSTTPKTLRMAASLVESGADLADVCDEVYQSYPIARVKLLRHVLNNFKLTEENKIAYYWLRSRDYSRCGAEREDAEGLIDHVRAIEPVIVAVQFEELTLDLIRVSFRSKNPYLDVGEVAKIFNGGGHKAASGATIEGTRLSVQRRVVKALRMALSDLKKQKKEEPSA